MKKKKKKLLVKYLIHQLWISNIYETNVNNIYIQIREYVKIIFIKYVQNKYNKFVYLNSANIIFYHVVLYVKSYCMPNIMKMIFEV